MFELIGGDGETLVASADTRGEIMVAAMTNITEGHVLLEIYEGTKKIGIAFRPRKTGVMAHDPADPNNYVMIPKTSVIVAMEPES